MTALILAAAHEAPSTGVPDRRRALVAEIAVRVPQPVDALEIAAVIESMGITDSVAADDYGVPTTFALAALLFPAVMDTRRGRSLRGNGPKVGPPPGHREARRTQIIEDSARGLLILAPAALVIAAVQASAHAGWNVGSVLALSLGVAVSMLITNGFIYGAGRRASFYLGLGYPGMARRFLTSTIVSAAMVIATMAGVSFVTLWGFDAFTADERAIFTVTLVAFSALWLLVGALSIAGAVVWVGVGFGCGFLAGVAADLGTKGITPAHVLVGIVAGYVVATAIMTAAFRRSLSSPEARKSSARLPATSYLFFESWPYFGYGSLFMVLLLEAHVLGWFGGAEHGESRLSSLPTLEFALTCALPPVVVATGLAERTLRRFWKYAKSLQDSVGSADASRFGRRLISFHRRHLLAYIRLTGGLSLALFVSFEVALQSGRLAAWIDLANPDASEFIFIFGLLSFWLLGIGQFSCMFMLSLARPRQAVGAVLLAIAVLTTTGVPLSLISFRYAAVAFAAGSAVFALSSFWSCRRMLASGHQYYSAAF